MYFSMAFCLFSSVYFSFRAKDVLEIAESAAPASCGIFIYFKSAAISINSEKMFKIMDEINEINFKCKIRYLIITSEIIIFLIFLREN